MHKEVGDVFLYLAWTGLNNVPDVTIYLSGFLILSANFDFVYIRGRD